MDLILLLNYNSIGEILYTFALPVVLLVAMPAFCVAVRLILRGRRAFQSPTVGIPGRLEPYLARNRRELVWRVDLRVCGAEEAVKYDLHAWNAHRDYRKIVRSLKPCGRHNRKPCEVVFGPVVQLSSAQQAGNRSDWASETPNLC